MKVPGVGPGEPTLGVVSFEIEQTILPQLTGSHVPRVVAVGDDRDAPLHRDGGDRRRRARGRGHWRAPLPTAEVAHIGAALADAVHSVHRQQVIHLDIKPENFILRTGGRGRAARLRLRAPRALSRSPGRSQVVRRGLGGLRIARTAAGRFAAILAATSSRSAHCSTSSRRASRHSANPRRSPECATGCGACRSPPRSLVPDIPPWLQEIILHCLETRADAALSDSGARRVRPSSSGSGAI